MNTQTLEQLKELRHTAEQCCARDLENGRKDLAELWTHFICLENALIDLIDKSSE